MGVNLTAVGASHVEEREELILLRLAVDLECLERSVKIRVFFDVLSCVFEYSVLVSVVSHVCAVVFSIKWLERLFKLRYIIPKRLSSCVATELIINHLVNQKLLRRWKKVGGHYVRIRLDVEVNAGDAKTK